MKRYPRFTTTIKLENDDKRRLYLPDEEQHDLTDVLDEAPTSDRFMILTLLHTGARSIELARIRPCDVWPHREGIRIYSAKKRAHADEDELTRLVKVTQWFVHELHAFACNKPPRQPIWPISRWTILRKTKHYMTKAGIPECRQTARSLRHSFASSLVHDIPIHLVSEWLGHKYIETTMIYTQVHEDPRISQAISEIRRRRPPC